MINTENFPNEFLSKAEVFLSRKEVFSIDFFAGGNYSNSGRVNLYDMCSMVDRVYRNCFTLFRLAYAKKGYSKTYYNGKFIVAVHRNYNSFYRKSYVAKINFVCNSPYYYNHSIYVNFNSVVVSSIIDNNYKSDIINDFKVTMDNALSLIPKEEV